MKKKTPRKSGSTRSGKTKSRKPSLTHELVKTNVLFSNVHPRTIGMVVPLMTSRSFRKGETIFDESTRGRHLYLIFKGKVRISKTTRMGHSPRLAVLHEGDFFGELSIIDGLPRSARAIAVDPCMIGLLPAAEFRRLMYSNANFASNVLLNMAIRLRTIDQTFVSELERNWEISQTKLEKLRLLVDASRTVNSTIDLDRVLDLILDAARRSIRADRGTLYLLDEDRKELTAEKIQGESGVEIRLPLGKGLAGFVAKTGETINIQDAYRDPRFNPEIDRRSGYKTHTVLCIPMRDKDGTIQGVFQFLNKLDGAFTEEDESFIAAYSIHASIALTNARLVQQIVESERLAAVGKMAAQIIHDIRGPMASLKLYVEVIKRRSEGGETERISVEIMKQIDRVATMAQEILDFSRGSTEMNLDTISCDDLTEASFEVLRGEMKKKNVELITDLTYHGELTLDIDKILRVFHNIAGNAIEAMPNGGSLTVRALKKDQQVCFEFKDTGPGIPEELRSKIFQPFFTFGKKHGTGLGLAIVRKIVEAHHGRVEIDTQVNEGTTFRVLLPLNG